MRHIASSIVAIALMTGSAAAQELTAYDSKYPVKETADRLAAELDKRGIKVAARIDHAAGAKSVGLEMPPTEVIMFGNPRLGTPLMLAQPTVGIDLPMKILIWQAPGGTTRVGFQPPTSLPGRHQMTGQDETLKTMTGALTSLARTAAGL